MPDFSEARNINSMPAIVARFGLMLRMSSSLMFVFTRSAYTNQHLSLDSAHGFLTIASTRGGFIINDF